MRGGFLIFFALFSFCTIAQNAENFSLKIRKASGSITVDGHLDEQSWKDADVARDFFRVLPMDTGYAETRTEVRMTYDDRYIYMGITC